LIQALKDNSSLVRQGAAFVLGYLKEPRAVEPLIQSLKDEDKYVRKAAAKSLGDIGSPLAVDPLIQTLKDKDSDVREAAASSLKKTRMESRVNIRFELLRRGQGAGV
jgi:HEAT repeat protein